MFLNKASQVVTRWLTWCGQPLTFLGCNASFSKHCGMQCISALYYSMCICSTIGKHTLACN